MAAAAIPTGFTELLITRIITDVYHLLVHQTHAGADRSGSQAGPTDDGYRIYPVCRTDLSGIRDARARARAAVYIRRRKKRQKTAGRTRRANET